MKESRKTIFPTQPIEDEDLGLEEQDRRALLEKRLQVQQHFQRIVKMVIEKYSIVSKKTQLPKLF